VFTAVEDFMEQTDLRLELTRLPGIHGLGILVPSQLKERNEKLVSFLEKLHFSPFVWNYVEGVERARLDLQILQQEERIKQRRRLEEESRTLRETRQVLREARQEARRKLKESHEELRAERHRLKEAERELAKLAGWIEELDEGIYALLNSRQWKTGHAMGELRRRALRKSEEPTAADHLEAVLERFRTWRREHDDPQPDVRATGSEEGDLPG
jgi:chromosome segregation ATPase